MHQFFVDRVENEQFTLAVNDAEHVRVVLRMRPGDELLLVMQGRRYAAVLTEVSQTRVGGRLVAPLLENHEPLLPVHIVQAVTKGEKMDYMIQKCTELGATAFHPVLTVRTVVKLDANKAKARCERWQKIAQAAAKQCRRDMVPLVYPLLSWSRMLDMLPADSNKILLYEQQDQTIPLSQALHRFPRRQVYLMIGPEGGLDPAEVEQAVAHHIQPVSMGARILRAETAGPAALAVTLYHFGDLGGSYVEGSDHHAGL